MKKKPKPQPQRHSDILIARLNSYMAKIEDLNESMQEDVDHLKKSQKRKKIRKELLH